MTDLKKYIKDIKKESKNILKQLKKNDNVYYEEEETIKYTEKQAETTQISKKINFKYKLLTKCNRCIMNQVCPVFDKEREIVELQTKKVIENKIKKAKIDFENDNYQQQLAIYQIQNNKEQYFKHILTNSNVFKNKFCKFEEDIIKETYQEYDIIKYPQIKSIVGQIVTLKLEAFRLQKIKYTHGEARYNNKGELKLTPGLHYTIEIADKMAKLTKNIDEIINGIKTVNTNISVNFEQAVKLAWEKRKQLNMKKVEQLN